ncbi:Bro-N domain-containing protein [Patescibacteria group bacterium]|nr:Bro-N domain-containing protein [Patescibacteria group bacterium]
MKIRRPKVATKAVVFKGSKIRRHWDEKHEKWWFSVVDVVQALTDSVNPRDYWFKMKIRMKSEDGMKLSTNCRQLKLESADGKKYKTDCANTEGILRIIQSIPSPKAEPFKLWLARVGYERIEEAEDPEKAIQRAMHLYLKRGYSRNWVNQRLKSIEIRKELTDEWENRGVRTGDKFAILTDDITFAWAGMRTKNYKKFKDLRKENLRDNMTNLELVLNMLAEVSTTEISKKVEPKSFGENRKVAKEGGSVAAAARRKLEKKTGKKVVTRLNAKGLKLLNKSKTPDKNI